MRKITYPLILAVICCFGPGETVLAQRDSTHLDLGYAVLDKRFTQTLHVSGRDLEKMPFTNLADAISAWFYGGYTKSGYLLYVVDGNPVSDPNAYSVFDIEEVTLVQDASALIGVGTGPSEVVLVTTRRGRGKKGITISAQTGLVNAGIKGYSTDTRMYHQYYAGVDRKVGKVSFGLSGGFQRDVFPLAKADDIKTSTPLALQRWRLNGYLDWRLNSHNLIEAGINYTPQKLAVEQNSTSVTTKMRVDAPQHLLLPTLRWRSELLPGLTNDLQGAYSSSEYKEKDEQVWTFDPSSLVFGLNRANASLSNHRWRIRDRIAYTISAGDWRIEPAVNFSYDHFDEKFTDSTIAINNYDPSSLNPPTGVSTSMYTSSSKGKMGILIPAVDITFRRALNIQGGLSMNLSKWYSTKKNQPFVRVALDLLELGSTARNNSLKVFGSYADRSNYSLNGPALVDLNNSGAINVDNYFLGGSVLAGVNYSSSRNEPYTQQFPAKYWGWESGASYTTANQRLILQYALERRNNYVLGHYVVPTGSFYAFEEWRSTLHHLEIRAKLLEGKDLRWEMGLNLTLLRNKPKELNQQTVTRPGLGQSYPEKSAPTGGWVNRIMLHRFTAGLDLLYHFSETIYAVGYNGSGTPSKVNSVVIPNIYAGYTFHSLELFLESRGLIRNRSEVIMDLRRYYTFGAKLDLQ